MYECSQALYIYSITNYNVCREQKGKDGKEREREREKKERKEREREEGRLCVCTCMCAHLYPTM